MFGRSVSVVALLSITIGCQPADEISNYQVPTESRTVDADIPAASPPKNTGRKTMQRMLAAIIPNGDRAWFVKAMGPVEDIASIEPGFRPFVESLVFKADKTPEWTLPGGWSQSANTSQMRFATIKAKEAEVAVSFLGLSGDLNDYLLRNINRWRGQVGLANIAVENLSESTTTVKLAGDLEATLIDITGESAGAPMAPFAGGGTSAALPPSHPPISNLPPAHPSVTAAPAGPARPNSNEGGGANADDNGWDIPSDWTPGRMSAMRKAAYNVESDGKKAEITVIGLIASGLTDNVNRWRGEIGLDNITEAEAEAAATTIQVDGAESRMVVLDGGEGKQSTAAVIVPKGQRMWFVKMKGDTEIVLKQVEAFKRFASSLTF